MTKRQKDFSLVFIGWVVSTSIAGTLLWFFIPDFLNLPHGFSLCGALLFPQFLWRTWRLLGD